VSDEDGFVPSQSYVAFRTPIGWQTLGTPKVVDAVWATSKTDVWAVGLAGAVHWDGATWTKAVGPTAPRVVWGSATNDVWLGASTATDPLFWHWDGSAWTSVASIAGATFSRIDALSGTGPNDVWAVGDGGVARFDGVAWTTAYATTAPVALRDVWAASPTSVWAVGAQSGILHWDGVRWSETTGDPTIASVVFTSVRGRSDSDVFASSTDNRMWHWDGTMWTSTAIGASGFLFGTANTMWLSTSTGVLVGP